MGDSGGTKTQNRLRTPGILPAEIGTGDVVLFGDWIRKRGPESGLFVKVTGVTPAWTKEVAVRKVSSHGWVCFMSRANSMNRWARKRVSGGR